MCEFCKLDEGGDGKEITRLLAVEPIDMGSLCNVIQLSAWLMSDELGEEPKLQLILDQEEKVGEIAKIEIPIKYCPICGRKLVD